MARRNIAKRKQPPGRVGGTYFKAWRIFRDQSIYDVADRIADLIESGDVSKKVGCTATRVTEKENGKEPWDNQYLGALALALDVSGVALQFVDPFDDDASPGAVLLESMSPQMRERAEDAIRTYKIRDDKEKQGE